MRSASTSARTEEILGGLTGSQLKAELILYYEKDGEWLLLEDLDEQSGVGWKQAGQRFDYTNINLVPAASTISFNVKNFNGKYSPGSGTFYDNVLDINTRVKLLAGYKLRDYGPSQSLDMSMVEGAFGYSFYTRFDTGVNVLDSSNTAGNEDIYFNDLWGTYYDSETYDDSFYTPAGYFVSTYSFPRRDLNLMTSFTVSANTTNGTIYYRTFNDRQAAEQTALSTNWTNAGATSNGDTVVTISSTDKFIQVAVVYDGVSWGDSDSVTGISLSYQSKVEYIYKSVYYLDSPEYSDPSVPETPVIACNGRDAYKKAIETDINLFDLSGGSGVDDIIKNVCDQIGLGYTTDSIADLSGFGDRVLSGGLDDTPKATDVFQKCMEIITQKGETRYVMYVRYDETSDDNILFVQPRAETFDDFVAFSKQYVSQIGFKKRNYDRLLKRMTVVSKNGVADKSELLDSDTFTTVGTKTLSWSGDAEYKYYTVTTSGNVTVALDTTTPVNPTSIDFVLTSSGGVFSVTINVYGNKWKSGAPSYEGESINHANMVANAGQTRRIENLLVLSDAECQKIAEGFVEDYGDPTFEVGGLEYPYLNLLADQNDPALIISPIVFINTIYYITGIDHKWDRSSSPADRTTYTLTDSGLTFESIVDYRWDTGLRWDSGLIWDQDLPLDQTEDVTDYDYLKPVEFA